MVRDQVGQTLNVEGAELILLRGNEEISRTPIIGGLGIEQNYELKIKIDANRPATTVYNASAIAAESQFNLRVEMNGSVYQPIEASNSLSAGKGGERVKLDLTLGIDSDGDGLPDTWEEWQLYQAGYFPGDDGWDLSLLDRDGDFDKDGQSNWDEYLAGTFAGDHTDSFKMTIAEKTDDFVRFEFYAITGKTYTLERLDEGTWKRVPFATDETSDRFESYRASAVSILPAYCDPSNESSGIFRLKVR